MSTVTPPWPPERHPSADEWVAWFLANDDDGQREIAAKAIGMMSDINRCLSSGCCWIDR